jgi:hypothetical protein
MSTKFVGFRWQRWLPWTAGAAALLGCALVFAPPSPAQGKKKEAAKAAKTGKAKKGADETLDPAVLEKAIANRPADRVESAKGPIEPVAYINEQVEKGWRDNKVLPSPRCTDYEFVRRASLDIIGRIPTVAEINYFLKEPEDRRRSKLIDRLIDSKECAENFANIWTVMLLTRSGSQKVFQEQLREWLTEQFEGTTADPPDWTKTTVALLTATGETNKNGAVNYVLHHVGDDLKQDVTQSGKWDMVPVTSRTTRLFLGIRTQCVQCHDHPFNGEWRQDHFWGINAFFRQVDTNGRPTMMVAKKKVKGVPTQQFGVKDNPGFNIKGLVPYERRNGVLLVTDPSFLDGKKIPRGSQAPRREVLAKFVTKSPNFSKAFVNRMWGHFMGKSFTKDGVDDFGEHNPASHPELLDKLAEDWVKYNHNPKTVIRWICNSRPYGLTSVSNRFNDKMEDETLFARMLLKPMTPEQMFDSLMTATQAKINQSKDDKRALRADWLSLLSSNFGNDEGEESSYSGTVVQALLLMNGVDLNKAIMDKENGTVAVVLKMRAFSANAAPRALTDLYLAALSRPPTKAEMEHMLSPKMFAYIRTPGAMNSPQFWTGYYQDIFWALLNSNEFVLNH